MNTPVVIIAIFSVAFPAAVYGHGIMMDPVNRASRWRKGFRGPKEYTDNQLSCGGRNVQWGKHKGKCGVCGDEYGISNPKFQYPGAFATKPPIVETYTQGQKIDVTIKITANHLGYFTFRLTRVVKQPITQGELDNTLLRMLDGNAEWKLPPGNGDYTITLQLPGSLTCEHCVLQWWWNTGNNWVNDRPETFVNCADIAIVSRGEGKPRPTVRPEPTKPTRRPKPSTRTPPTKRPRPTRPSRPASKCRSVNGQPNMDKWCERNCAAGFCPESHCICQ